MIAMDGIKCQLEEFGRKTSPATEIEHKEVLPHVSPIHIDTLLQKDTPRAPFAESPSPSLDFGSMDFGGSIFL